MLGGILLRLEHSNSRDQPEGVLTPLNAQPPYPLPQFSLYHSARVALRDAFSTAKSSRVIVGERQSCLSGKQEAATRAGDVEVAILGQRSARIRLRELEHRYDEGVGFLAEENLAPAEAPPGHDAPALGRQRHHLQGRSHAPARKPEGIASPLHNTRRCRAIDGALKMWSCPVL